MAKRIKILLCFLLFAASPAHASNFDAWLQNFAVEAGRAGISPQTLHRELSLIEYNERTIALDRKQPEHKITFAKYLSNTITPARVKKGREMMEIYAAQLDRISRGYGVPAKYIVALWAIETDYGRNTGGFDTISALATLAYEGRRAAFFKSELIEALRILDNGHIDRANMRGSWAGAMGQNQFMPSSFWKYAVDYNQDGHTDIWRSLPDVFASTANYLRIEGWNGAQSWGREVRVPKGKGKTLPTGRDIQHPLTYWQQAGLRTLQGANLPNDSSIMASLIQPDGPGGRSFLVYKNYNVIMHWNRSTYFATTVGLLADQLGGRG